MASNLVSQYNQWNNSTNQVIIKKIKLKKELILYFTSKQLSPLNILPYQYPQAASVGSLGHSTIGSAGLSPTQSISSTSSQSNASASPDVISTPESPLSVNNCTSSANNIATASSLSGTSSNNYSFHQSPYSSHHHHHPMDIATAR